ncbi:MAG: TonB-dependent receptor [Acidobacteriota bacterium]
MTLRHTIACFLLVPFTLALAAPADDPQPQGDASGDDTAQRSALPTLEETVVVTATRAGEDEPATHTNIPRQAIAREFWAQDMPSLLRLAPSVHHYADAGIDLGYSYLSVRGFDQRRVAVTINGVPLNGAESHQVYWVDLPGFADMVEDIQVQRGVGKSLYGAGAIGGRVNVETVRLAPGEAWSASAGWGSWSTSKVHASWKSDLLGDGWVLGLSASRLATDGWREHSGARMAMVFLTAQKLGERSVLRINVFGGKEKTELAYLGLTRAELAADRRQNPLRDLDTFYQPHFQVIHEWQPRDGLTVENTWFAFYGRGKFDQNQDQAAGFEFKIGDPALSGAVFEGVRRERWIGEWDYGWLPKVTWRHGRGTLTAGAELRIHRGHQWGDVEAETPPAGAPPRFRYYDYRIPKTSVTLYAQEEWKPDADTTILAGLQRVSHRWSLEDELSDPLVADPAYVRFGYDVEYAWWAPRIGVHRRFGDALSGFVSVAESRREPTAFDLYNIQEWYESPAFRTIDPATGRLADPIPREEKLRDYEAGLRWRTPRAMLAATVYEMRFRDELVILGALNDVGLPVTGNSERSTHRGIELEFAARPTRSWELSGHLTVSRDVHDRFVENVFDSSGALVPVDRSGNRVAGFPERLGRIAVAWTPPWGRVELGALHTGRIYVDNSETRERSVDPSTVLHLDAAWTLARRGATLRLRINNLLDEEYESFGYFWGVEPTFIPAAGRHAFLMLSWRP